MADNGFKINKSANFNPQSGAPTNPVDGDFYYDATMGSFVYYHAGSWANMDSIGLVSASANMTSAQFTPSIVQNSIIRVSGTGPCSIHGMSASFSGKQIIIFNNTNTFIILKYQSVTEPTSNNRFISSSGGDMNLMAGEVATFIYDVVTNRWYLAQIDSGAGAHITSTTTNNGIVTLHMASATPAAPTVLTDGDFNVANGVVGLSATRSASITPSSGNTIALTLTGLGTGSGLTATGGATAGTGVTTTGGAGGVGLIANKGAGGTDAAQFNGIVNISENLVTTGSGDFGSTMHIFGNTQIESDLQVLNNTDLQGTLGVSLATTLHSTLNVTGTSTLGVVTGTVALPSIATDISSKRYTDNSTSQNLLINSNFAIRQRGSSWPFTSTRAFGPDRWHAQRAGGNGTLSLQSVTPVNGHFNFSLRTQRNAGDANTGSTRLIQEIDRGFMTTPGFFPGTIGSKLTLSGWYRTGTDFSGGGLDVLLLSGTGSSTVNWLTGYTGTGSEISQTLGANTSWTYFEFTTSAAWSSSYSQGAVIFRYAPSGTAGVDDWFEVTGLMLNPGDSAASWKLAGRTPAGEISLCERFYEKSYALLTAPGTNTSIGIHTTTCANISTSNGSAWPIGHHPRFRVRKIFQPTISLWLQDGTSNQWSFGGVAENSVGTTGSADLTSGFQVLNNTGGPITPTGVVLGHWAADAEI